MQTEYNNSLTKAVEGGLGDSGVIDIVSRRAAVAIPFGYGVIATANEGEGTLPSVTGFILDGVAVQVHKAKDNASAEAQYDANDSASVLKKGRIWVLAEETVDPTSPVFLRHTANGGTTAPGRFRASADTARADEITNARWVTTTTAADQLALLEINMP